MIAYKLALLVVLVLPWGTVLAANQEGELLWHTFMGSTVLDDGNAIAVDGSGNVYVAGSSLATWGTPMNVFVGGPWDGFAAKLDSSGNLLWNTFMGSPGPTLGNDYGEDIAVDSSGNAYVVGPSGSTWGTPLNAFAGAGDAFVVKLNSSGARVWNTFIGSAGYDDGSAVAVDASDNVYAAGASYATAVYRPNKNQIFHILCF